MSVRVHRILALALLLALAIVQSATSVASERGASRPTCHGKRATIVGTSKADQIVGSRRADVIVALGGSDVIRGGDGDDTICAGPGKDEVYGRTGADVLSGQLGEDTLKGGPGPDRLMGGAGNDRELGGAGKDVFLQGKGPNGWDRLLGGAGRDRADFSRRTQRVSIQMNTWVKHWCEDVEDDHAETEELIGGAGDDTLVGTRGDELLIGGSGDDALRGGAGDDALYGESGNDGLVGGAGDNVLDGGTGENHICVLMSTCDIDPPELSYVSISPDVVDNSVSDQYVTVKFGLTDNLSGIRSGRLFIDPIGGGLGGSGADFYVRCAEEAGRLSKDFRFRLPVKKGWEQAEWALYLQASDNTRNAINFDFPSMDIPRGDWTFQQIGASPDSDQERPVVHSISFLPTEIDTSGAARTITVRFHATDDITGIRTSSFGLALDGPGSHGRTLDNGRIKDVTRISGTKLDGIYEGTFTMPRWSPQGVWTVDAVGVFDEAGRSFFIGADDPMPVALQASFTQVGPGDTQAPTLESLSVTPTQINTSDAARLITVTARITDDLAGLKSATVGFGNLGSVSVNFSATDRISGTAQDGVYRASALVPRYSYHGKWVANTWSGQDLAGNRADVDPTIVLGYETYFWNGTPTG